MMFTHHRRDLVDCLFRVEHLVLVFILVVPDAIMRNCVVLGGPHPLKTGTTMCHSMEGSGQGGNRGCPSNAFDKTQSYMHGNILQVSGLHHFHSYTC